MNKVVIKGRLTKDPKVNHKDDGKVNARVTVAVQRTYKNKDGEYDADFIPILAFGKTAEFIEKYFHKGDEIMAEGEWRTGSYEKDGAKIYTNECNVNKVEFCGSKKKSGEGAETTTETEDKTETKVENKADADGFEPASGDIPFFNA